MRGLSGAGIRIDEASPALAGPPNPKVVVSTEAPQQSAQRRRVGTGILLGITGAIVAAYTAVWLLGLDLGIRPPLPARIQQDAGTGLISLLGDLTARLSALGALGVLAAIVGFQPKDAGHRLSERSQRLVPWAARLAQVWFAAALLNTFANAAYVNGVPIHTTMTPGSWWTFLWASPSALAWFVSALVAFAIVVASYVSKHWATSLIGLVAGVVSLTFVAVTGNVTVGLGHDWATDAAIALTLSAAPLFTAAVGAWLVGTKAATDRYQKLVLPLLALAAAGHATVSVQQLAGTPMTGTMYGLACIAILAILALVALSWLVRQFTGRRPGSVGRDVVLAIAYVAALAAENHIPTPRFLEPQSIMVNYLGYEVTVAPTIARLVGLSRPNVLWVLIVLFALGTYAAGVWKAHRAGRRWPLWRSIAWAASWLLTLFLAVTGLWEYSTVMYSWHMVVHMTVNMMVPVLAVLGAPFLLMRTASTPKPEAVSIGEAVDALEDHRLWQVLTGPPAAWLAYVGSLFVVYYTPAFAWLMKYHWAHQLMLLFFMVTGYFFFTQIVGADHPGRQLPHLLKLALVISIMPFHAVFAVGILSSATLIGKEFYEVIAAPFVPDLMADQNIAGQAAWFLGEIPLFLVIIALAAQWFGQDKKDATELDRRDDSGEDDSYDAYNDMLAELARRDRRSTADDVLKRLEP